MTRDVRLSGVVLLLALALVLLAGVVSGFGPPPPPTLSAQDIATIYQQRSHQILVFAVLMILSATCCLPAYAAFTVLMRRMEPRSWFLPLLHLLGAIFAVGGPYFSAMFFAAAAFRPSMPPAILQALNDLGIMFNQVTMPGAIPHGLALYVAIMRDHAHSQHPVLPRWVGWLYLAYAVLSLPGLFTIFFKDGPFAWNGAIGIGAPLTGLVPWMILSAVVLMRVAPQTWRAAEQDDASPQIRA